MDFYVIFLIQSSEFIKLVNFGSNWKKTERKNLKKIIPFSLKNWFLYIKKYISNLK